VGRAEKGIDCYNKKCGSKQWRIEEEIMSKNVMVAYESKYGATKEIAERIAGDIKSSELKVTLKEASNVKDLGEVSAVVLGSAVYYGRWRKGAVKFLKKFEQQLSNLPVWFFSSGPIGDGDPVELLDGWKFPPLQQEIADRIEPRGVVVFHGKLDEVKLNIIEKKIMETMETPAGDFRNWEMISQWANSVAAEISTQTNR
jgi:menaquinone-dependent protoporphyrinogen oxidase